MAFKTTKWEHSNETVRDVPQEGVRNLYIRDAEYDDEGDFYRIAFTDLEDGTEFLAYHYLSYKSGKPNNRSRAALITLNKALFDEDQGYPYPRDIVGGVVRGSVELKQGETRSFVQMNAYAPCPRELYFSNSEIDQYYEGYDEDHAGGDGGERCPRGAPSGSTATRPSSRRAARRPPGAGSLTSTCSRPRRP